MKHTVTEYKLTSGARGLVIDVPGSSVANVVVRFNSGYQFADQMTYEVPHVMEHLLATVTQKYPGPNEFMIEAQKNGAYVNAHTSSVMNGYVYECADFELARILDLLEEQLARPLFASGPFKAEIGNVREELTRNTTEHGRVCDMQLNERAFPGQVLGYEARLDQLPNLTVQAMKDHYEATHTAANARFFVAGALGEQGVAVVARLDRLFDQLPRGKRLVRNPAIGLGQKAPIVTHRDIKQLYYAFDMYLDELNEGERRAMSLLRLVLVGGMGSRIKGEARRRGLAYHVGSGGNAERGNTAYGFSGYVTPGNAEELFRLITREFRSVVDGNLTGAELGAAKDLGIGSAQRSHQTTGDLLGWYVGPYDGEARILDFDGYMADMRTVTVEDVVAVAQRIAGYGRHGLSILGDLDAAQGERYGEIFEEICE